MIGKGMSADPKEYVPLPLRSVTTWEAVDGYGGDYFVSTDGRVYSAKRQSEKLLSQYSNQTGTYLIVKLHDGEGGKEQRSVHTLVLEAFRGVPDGNGLFVAHHKDGDPTNNDLTNLEWVTPEENAEQAREDAEQAGKDDGALSTIDAAPF